MLKTSVYEKMIWTDNRLVWDKDDFEGIDRLQVNADEVRNFFEFILKISTNMYIYKYMLYLLFFNKFIRFGNQILHFTILLKHPK